MTDLPGHVPASSTGPPDELQLIVTDEVGGEAQRRAREWSQLQSDLATTTQELVRDLLAVPADEDHRPSLCQGWDLRDVVSHLLLGDARAITSLLALSGPAPPAHDPDEAPAREDPLPALARRFARGRRRLMDVIADIAADAAGRHVSWFAGDITAFSLVQSRLMETWIHGWDVRWPLGLSQPYDDRCWWLADIAVRHIPYSMRLAQLPSPSIDLSLTLDGIGGGTWDRAIGDPPRQTVEIAGPAWAWVTWAARRTPARVSADLLVHGPGELTVQVVRLARSFA